MRKKLLKSFKTSLTKKKMQVRHNSSWEDLWPYKSHPGEIEFDP